MSPLIRIKEMGVANTASTLVHHWKQGEEEPLELKASIDLEELKNSLAKYTPELRRAEKALGELRAEREEQRRALAGFFKEFDKINAEKRDALGS